MNTGIQIAGIGVISAIGLNLQESLQALKSGQAGMGPMRRLHSAHADHLPVAEVALTNEALAAMSGMNHGIHRTALLSAVAAGEALRDTGLNEWANLRTGFVSANSVGGMDQTELFFLNYGNKPESGRLRQVVHHECGAVTEQVAEHLGIRDYVTTISTACSSSANAIFHAARMIKAGLLDLVVAGGTDALARFTLNGFNTLMILDEAYCRPFDETRTGLNLGEGAGYIVLASDQLVQERGLKSYARLTGYCNANDAFHQTASSPEGQGSYLAMQGALEMAQLRPDEISYINLHGTGTQNNDLSEGTAIQRIFGDTPPPMSSTKSFTGHTLGASGGIEAVFSVLSIQHGLIYPNLRFAHRMKELPFDPVTELHDHVQIRHVLSNSFGFGGNCSSLIFSGN